MTSEVHAEPVTEEEYQRDPYLTVMNLMRQAQELTKKIAEVERWLDAYTRSVGAEQAQRRTQLNHIEAQIKLMAEPLIPEGQKHVDVPKFGRVQFRDYAERIVIVNDGEFIEALGADERERLVEHKPHLNRNEAKKYARAVLDESGELLPGAERIPAERLASIRWEA